MPRLSTYGLQRIIGGLPPDDVTSWEDEDELSLPIPPNERDAADPESVAFEESRKAATSPYDRVTEAYRRKAAYEETRPQLGNHKPNKWQRLAAVAANAAAGYVNAGRRTRVDDRAMDSLNRGLLRPGYDRAMEEWKDRGAGIEAEVEGARTEAQIEAAKQKAVLDTERALAYKKAQESQAAYNAARKDKLNEDRWKIGPTGKILYNEKTGQTKIPDGLPLDPGPVRETPQAKTERMAREAVEMLGYAKNSDEYRAYLRDPAALERIKAKNRPAKGGGKAKERLGTVGQFDRVDDKTAADYAKAENEALKMLQQDRTVAYDPADPWKIADKEDAAKVNRVREWLTRRKNEIAKRYANRVRTLGGSAEQVLYSKDGNGDKKKSNDPLGIR